ncbi:MAG: hydroxyacylglutathione hydrolase [Myxococcota bacterium]|jgi:hydroxyacylglutathione hydrolase
MILLSLLLTSAQAADVIRFSSGFTNVYAIVGPENIILVDAHNPDQEDWIIKQLERHDLSIDDVSLVIATHAHSDHAGSAAALQKRGIPVALGADDAYMARRGQHDEPMSTDWRGDIVKRTVDPDYPAFEPDVLVTDRLDLSPYGVNAEAVVVGGHSPGSLVIKLDDQRVISGDLLRGHMIRQRRPALHFFQLDLEVAHQAARTLIEEGATELLVAHGKNLPAGKVSRWLD